MRPAPSSLRVSFLAQAAKNSPMLWARLDDRALRLSRQQVAELDCLRKTAGTTEALPMRATRITPLKTCGAIPLAEISIPETSKETPFGEDAPLQNER